MISPGNNRYSYENGDPRMKCERCTKVDLPGSKPAGRHCGGDHRSVFRPGEKSRTIRCRCDCNDNGQVQARKGHTRLTREMFDNTRRDYIRYWRAHGKNLNP
jgi:hypothetical protein